MRHVTRRARRLLLGLTVGSVLLTSVACGSGTSAAGETVTIAKPVDTIGFTALDLAQQQGYFKQAGLNVKTVLLGGSSVANAALQSGSAQFATGASLPLLQARQKGLPLISVAAINFGVPLQLIAGKNLMSKVDSSQPLNARLKILDGKTIGYVSATDGGFVDLLLKRAGIAASSVKKVAFDSATAAVTAATEGRIDAAIGSPPNTLAPVSEKKAAVIANVAEIHDYKEMTYDLLATTTSYVKDNAKTVQAVATAIAKADNFMRNPANIDTVLKLESAHYPKYPQSVLRESISLENYSPDGQQTAEQWNNAVKTYKDGGQITSGSAQENVAWTNQYVLKDKL